MVDSVIEQSGAQHVTITGGEPLIAKDALEIIEHVAGRVSSVQLITNGSHVSPPVAKRLAAAPVRSVQLTLLSADREKHDRLKGATCFDDTVRAAVELIAAGVQVQVCFVAMAENWEDFEGVMELCFGLGISSISYNRMSPTGWAIHELDRLLPEIEQVEHNLNTAERLGPKWKISVATAMPIPPCLIRIERYQWVRFGFCSVGTSSPNITVDALGNVRSCNLSSHIMGNATERGWSAIFRDRYYRKFRKTLPKMCKGCSYEHSCGGGCKESGFATFGSLTHPEPFIHFADSPGPSLGHPSLRVVA